MTESPSGGKHTLTPSESLNGLEPVATAESPVPEVPAEAESAVEPDPPDETEPPAPTDQVTCPECGTVAAVTLTRRDATDFCRRCDYPLFWTPARIVLGSDLASEDSLRRLPGTVGRVTVGSVPCPHCSEANTLSAEVCVRCGGLMNPPEPEPEPEPEPVPVVELPPPPPAPPPTPTTPWWVWAGGIATVLILIALMVYAVASMD